jgi:hypothetical protein
MRIRRGLFFCLVIVSLLRSSSDGCLPGKPPSPPVAKKRPETEMEEIERAIRGRPEYREEYRDQGFLNG